MTRTVFITIKAEMQVADYHESEVTEDDIQNFFSNTLYDFPPVTDPEIVMPDGSGRTIIADTEIIKLDYE